MFWINSWWWIPWYFWFCCNQKWWNTILLHCFLYSRVILVNTDGDWNRVHKDTWSFNFQYLSALILNRHKSMDYTQAALPRHFNSHLILCYSIHWWWDNRCVEGNVFRKVWADIALWSILYFLKITLNRSHHIEVPSIHRWMLKSKESFLYQRYFYKLYHFCVIQSIYCGIRLIIGFQFDFQDIFSTFFTMIYFIKNTKWMANPPKDYQWNFICWNFSISYSLSFEW